MGRTAGCNPAHRSSPLALCAHLPNSALHEAATTEARLTHWHPLAGEVASAVVRLCRALILGIPWLEALDLVRATASNEVQKALDPRCEAPLSTGGYAPEVLHAAVAFINEADDFTSALHASLEFAGPANYSPVLVGSIGGARWGRSQISNEDLQHQRNLLTRLSLVARDLAKEWDEA